MMNLQQRNWQNLFGHITLEGVSWHGIWTMYSPDNKVITTFKGIRKFQANEDQTIITHTNKYIYLDGKEQEIIWKIEKQVYNQPDGIIHPALLSMRALSFGDGANAVLSKQLEAETKFGAELFFRYQDWRTSVATIYDESGELLRISIICEELDSFPTVPAELETEKLSRNWIGQKESITPDLKISALQETQQLVLDPTEGKNQTFLLGDRIVVNAPKKVSLGEEFELVAGKMVAENKYKRLTAQYDNSGAFTMLISEVFSLQD
jgi:Domain of unknown function (DUF3598)